MNIFKKSKGFTLIELLVVIAIIGILASITVARVDVARQAARDSKRIAELNELKTAIFLYYEINGHFPREADGANGIVGEGSGLDTMLAPYMTKIPVDPRGPGNSTYNYYYDARHTCGGQPMQAVIFAKNLEIRPGNTADIICTSLGTEGRSGGGGSVNPYNVILGDSDG